jgi:hypothetical protein
VTGPTGSGATVLQSAFGEVTVDTSTTSNVFVDLITVPITTTGAILFLASSFAASPTGAAVAADFRLTLDGVPLRGAGLFMNTGQPESGAIDYRATGLAPGAHTVKLQWRSNSALLGVQIRPVTAPNTEHASLYVQEQTV